MWLQWCLHFSKLWYHYIADNNPTPVAFKNCAPFTNCITKTDGTKIDYAEDLEMVIPM